METPEQEINQLSNAAIRTKPNKKKGLAPKKKAFITTFMKTLNISGTCKKLGIGRTTFYDWMRDDPEFKRQFEDLNEFKKDWYIEKFDKLCDAGDSRSINNAIATFCKDRGYGKSIEQNIKSEGPIEIKLIDVLAPSEIKESEDGKD